jgi:sucrose phosphorylase
MLSKDELDTLVAHIEQHGGQISYKQNPDGNRSIYELNITYVDALADQNGSTEKHIKRFMMAQGIVLALAGVPAIYIHSLLGTHNNLEAVQHSGHNRAINRSKLQARETEAELQHSDSFRKQVYSRYATLIKIRRQHPAFHPKAAQHALDVGDAVFGLRRTSRDMKEQILILCNVTDRPQVAKLPENFSGTSTDLLTGKHFSEQVTLSSYQMLWIRRATPS